jgi:hypothetical protein
MKDRSISSQFCTPRRPIYFGRKIAWRITLRQWHDGWTVPGADIWVPTLRVRPTGGDPGASRFFLCATIPLPYPLPISLSISLRCGYPLSLSLSFLISLRPSASAQGSPPVALAFARPAACAFDGLTGDPSYLACYRPGPRGPKALGLAWRRWPRSAVTPDALLLLRQWLRRRKVLCSWWTLASSLTLLLCQRVCTPDPTLSCSYLDLLHPLHLHAAVLLVDLTTVQALVITSVVTLPVKGTVPMRYSCLFSQLTAMWNGVHHRS